MTKGGAAEIDVVVPVHNAIDDADRLLASLARATSASCFNLHVIDDSSAAGRDIALPQAGGAIKSVIFYRNSVNLGFAASVNLVLRKTRRDVVILNSDTLVYDGWLDRLRAAAATNVRTATVTPLSNVATILSYPAVCVDTKQDIEIEWAEIDRLCRDIGAPPVEIPTGVGFCMLITRACLDVIGLLDEATFGAGYGEECDFCRRAALNGWINLAAPDVFVWHRGQASFKERRLDLTVHAQAALDQRYPDYPRLIAAHLKRDPLKHLREELDLARVRKAGPFRLVIDANGLRVFTKGSNLLTLKRTGPRFAPVWQIEAAGPPMLPNLPRLKGFPSNNQIADFLKRIGPEAILVPDRKRYPSRLVDRICRMAADLGIPTEIAETSRTERSCSGTVDWPAPLTTFPDGERGQLSFWKSKYTIFYDWWMA